MTSVSEKQAIRMTFSEPCTLSNYTKFNDYNSSRKKEFVNALKELDDKHEFSYTLRAYQIGFFGQTGLLLSVLLTASLFAAREKVANGRTQYASLTLCFL